ncbi:MAG TPA: DUF2171 domain-containing protein [Dehalococcoidia bacterium]|nr:DUF2171 domain-containing protein [Dehalococcoidia bacterium]
MVTASELELGAKVMTADGKEIGTVREIGSDRFKVERRLFPDYWLANEYVDDVAGGIVQLIVTKEGLGAAKL